MKKKYHIYTILHGFFQVGCFVEFNMDPIWRKDCDCDTVYDSSVIIVDEKGNISFPFF